MPLPLPPVSDSQFLVILALIPSQRRLEDMLEVSLRQLDSRERELLDPVEEGNVAVDELYREIERVSDNLQLKFQVEAKSEFIHNFHLIQKVNPPFFEDVMRDGVVV